MCHHDSNSKQNGKRPAKSQFAQVVFFYKAHGLHLECKRKKCAPFFGAWTVKIKSRLAREANHLRINRNIFENVTSFYLC
jgi:hypothetical protein